jgi:hypothetical protein
MYNACCACTAEDDPLAEQILETRILEVNKGKGTSGKTQGQPWVSLTLTPPPL